MPAAARVPQPRAHVDVLAHAGVFYATTGCSGCSAVNAARTEYYGTCTAGTCSGDPVVAGHRMGCKMM
jgi:hypothetical protein